MYFGIVLIERSYQKYYMGFLYVSERINNLNNIGQYAQYRGKWEREVQLLWLYPYIYLNDIYILNFRSLFYICVYYIHIHCDEIKHYPRWDLPLVGGDVVSHFRHLLYIFTSFNLLHSLLLYFIVYTSDFFILAIWTSGLHIYIYGYIIQCNHRRLL